MVMIGYLVVSNPQSSRFLEKARRLAESEGYREIYFNQVSSVVSFTKSSKIDEEGVRINVYYTTGTVGTCIDHPRMGQTQLFRRKIGKQQLAEIFRNPRVHTKKGYHRRPLHSTTSSNPITEKSAMEYQRKLLLAEKCWIDEELAELQAGIEAEQQREQDRLEKDEAKRREKERLETERLAQIKRRTEEFERREKERLETERLSEIKRLAKEAEEFKRVQRGNKIDYWIEEGDFVGNNFSDRVTSLSCGGGATIMLYENGGWAWTSGLPKNLHNKLNGRQRTLPKPTYVSIGSQSRYYIQFADSKAQFVACDKMVQLLKNDNARTVVSVAFGRAWNSYAVVFSDGGYEYNEVPNALDDVIRVRRQGRGDLTCISLGPNGEYYVSAKNGKSWWGGTASYERINKYMDRIKFLDFSDHNHYVLRYS